jgi:hypothetical protein
VTALAPSGVHIWGDLCHLGGRWRHTAQQLVCGHAETAGGVWRSSRRLSATVTGETKLKGPKEATHIPAEAP